MRINRVLSYHLNPFTCGVARFNRALSSEMGVPLVPVFNSLNEVLLESSLLSIKVGEFSASDQEALRRFLKEVDQCCFALLLHGLDGSQLERELIQRAHLLLTATREMATEVSRFRKDVLAVFAPGAPVLPLRKQSDCTLLSFGMAHKLRADGYHRLSALVAEDERSFELQVSTALHEGGSFDETFFSLSNEIVDTFNGQVSFLGFLSDEEISRRLRQVSALVAFFPKGVRENNTTVLSAMAHGCAVITNIDSSSPTWMVHGDTVFDIDYLESIPSRDELARVGKNAAEVTKTYSFQVLSSIIKSHAAQGDVRAER
jgi:glycosyltransferase involved in cell wall biosynthesis